MAGAMSSGKVAISVVSAPPGAVSDSADTRDEKGDEVNGCWESLAMHYLFAIFLSIAKAGPSGNEGAHLNPERGYQATGIRRGIVVESRLCSVDSKVVAQRFVPLIFSSVKPDAATVTVHLSAPRTPEMINPTEAF